MRGYLKLKKIDVPIEETTVFKDQVPQKNKDYTLLVDVALKSIEKTQVEADEEDEETYFYMETVGDVRLIPNALIGDLKGTIDDAQPESQQPPSLEDTESSS